MRHGPGSSSPALAKLTVCPAQATHESAELIEDHLPLVGILVSERLRDLPAHIRRDELMSAGMLALVLSAGDYEPQRGVPFRTYAAFRIRGALIDELRTMDWASRSVRSRAREAETARTRLTATMDRSPGIGDIAEAMGISTRQLDAVYADLARGTVLSLQDATTDTLSCAPSYRTQCPETLILRRELLGYLRDAVAALPERLRFVVVAYFFGQRQMSDIAIEMAVSQSRVSQMCTEATALVRDGLNSQLDPDALQSPARIGRAAKARNAYYDAIADRNTVGGRLDMSTWQGDMYRSVCPDGVYPEQIETQRDSRIA